MADAHAPATLEMCARMRDKLGPTCAAAYPRHLEAHFPHIFAHIERLWGTPAMEPYFNELLITQRPGRQGFPDETIGELMALISAYRKLGLSVEKPSGDIWDWVSDIDIGDFDKSRRR